MKGMRLILAVPAVLLFSGGCGDGQAVLEPAAPEAALHGNAPESRALAGNPRILASGEFIAVVDFTTLTFTPQGNHCILVVEGQLIFSGTLEGVGSGTTTARVFATCEEVLANPPGTFRDVFRFEGVFVGTVDGEPAQADFVYQGRAEAGGRIDARIHISGGLQGVLHADAQLAVGGSYEGFVIRR